MRSSSSFSTAAVYLSLLLCMTQGTYTTTPNDHQILAEDPINVISNLVLIPEDTFIRATWTVENEASDYADKPQKYEMSYARDGETQICISFSGNDTSSEDCYTKPELSPCTEYNVTVTPWDCNDVTNGVPAFDIACTTGCEGDITCHLSTTTTTEPTTTTTEPTITTTTTTTTTNPTAAASTDSSMTSIAATTTSTTESTTDEDVVINLTLTPDVDIIHASWGLENPSGNVFFYTVDWVALSSSSQGATCTVDSPSTDTSSCTPSVQLSPCEEYSVTVQPLGYNENNEVGYIGVAATAEDYTLADDVDTVAVAPVCSSSGSTASDLQFTVSWETTGTCVRFTVTWEGDVLWQEGEEPITGSLTTREGNVFIDEPQPYTTYSVTVTWAGGERAQCEDTTPQTAPSAPLNLTSSEVTDSSLTVSWEPPDELNGWLTNYTITWEEGDDNDTMNVHNDTLTYTIEGLEADTSYMIIVKAVTVDESDPLTDSFCTLPSSSSSVGAIVGAVVGVLLVAALLTLTYIKRDSLLTQAYIKRDWMRDRITKPVQNDKINKQVIAHFYKLEMELAVKIKTLASHPGSLITLFTALEDRSYIGTTAISSIRGNAQKNRFVNILPFDVSRVVLMDDIANGNDYINASLVPGIGDRNLVFVASQTPKENTVRDFWRMVWNLKVHTIVMLSDEVDDSKTRSDRYWPGEIGDDIFVQQFNIKLMTEEVKPAYTLRILSVINDGYSRKIKQFHFSEWTPYNACNSTEEVLELLCDVRKNVQPEHKHIVVHCLAGVGRTGTLIALWNLQQLAESLTEDIDIEDIVLEMRRHRMQLLQTKEQYYLLLEAFLAYLRNRSYWFPVTEIRPAAGADDRFLPSDTEQPMYITLPSQSNADSTNEIGQEMYL